MPDSTWGTIAILFVGILVVVGSILALRLHAFLALIAAALVVALLTPESARERSLINGNSFSATLDGSDPSAVIVQAGEKQGLRIGTQLALLTLDLESRRYVEVATARVTEFLNADSTSEQSALATLKDPNSFDHSQQLRAIAPTELPGIKKELSGTIGEQVAAGFGNTCTSIGILIAMAAIIGKCLLDSGAADRIVRTSLKLFGEPAAPFAFMFSGFFLGVPVFFDTVFYLIIPLGKAMRMRTGRNYLLYVLTIVCGATMAHSLVPPTPGPLFVAQELGVDLGMMILVGTIVGLFCSLAGFVFAVIMNRMSDLPLRESPDFSLQELEETMNVEDDQLPGFWISCLPIILPVILITGETIIGHKSFPVNVGSHVKGVIATIGDKNIALMISALIALAVLIKQKRTSLKDLTSSIQGALASGGVIILITAAGGAFGQVLRQTGIADLIQNLPDSSPQVICTLAFLITAGVRTAQGSSTVAMITTVGILSSITSDGSLGFEPVYLAAAIGVGSKPIAWMNDSGFWVITKMSGMTEVEGLKYITPLSTIMGIVGLIVVLIGVTVYPNF